MDFTLREVYEKQLKSKMLRKLLEDFVVNNIDGEAIIEFKEDDKKIVCNFMFFPFGVCYGDFDGQIIVRKKDLSIEVFIPEEQIYNHELELREMFDF